MSENESQTSKEVETTPQKFIRRFLIPTERLLLMPMTPYYLESAWEYYGDDENCKHMLYLHDNKKEEIARLLEFYEHEWFSDEPMGYNFAVICQENGEHIGEVGFSLRDWEQIELSWIFARKFHNKGYCTEAMQAVIKWQEEFSNISAIMARCSCDNAASRRVIEKLGLSFWYSYKPIGKNGEERREDTFLLTLGEKSYEEVVGQSRMKS